ncbi:hypothetical protein NE237_008638 [Protea cynaroides]|uniref:Josephin-like protein n=1 Tax=Protea cynaroides TaxID=273540 RepID=A0A9Q0KVX5_9MAGN|nr:hypothetical protein NE237_008638 [Protea cynaroides]
MLRSGSSGLGFSPDVNDLRSFSFKERSSNPGIGGSRKGISGFSSFSVLAKGGFSPMKYLQRLGTKVARAVSLVSVKRRRSRRRSSSKVSSSNLTRSRKSIAPLESHQAEAIEDCIQFINSSSLQRSYSVSAV